MTNRKKANPFLGRWTIDEMDLWDNQLTGKIFFHHGAASGFVAVKK